MDEATVKIDYVNHRGVRAVRHISIIDIRFGSSEWHPDPQWLLRAVDLDRDVEREFAMQDIKSWSQQLCN